MGRRGENIRKRKSDNRWEARVVAGSPKDGKTVYKYLYGDTYREVREKKNEFLRAAGNGKTGGQTSFETAERETAGREKSPGAGAGMQTESKETAVLFKDAALAWLSYKKMTVKESTYACYSTMVNNHIIPVLGEKAAADLDNGTVEKFIFDKKINGRLSDNGELSDKTVSDLKAVLKQILQYAKESGMTGTVPDCPAVCCRRRVVSVLSRQEQELLEKTVIKEKKPFGLGVLISLYGGLRIGEVCALRWADIDSMNKTVSVHCTISRIEDVNASSGRKTKVIITSPKTECSVRTIPLPEEVFEYLWRYRRPYSCYVLTGTPKYMEPRVCRDHFCRLLKRAGIQRYCYHTLRHTFATRCAESGMDTKALSEIMGHTNVKITLERYVHPSMDAKREQMNKLTMYAVSGQKEGQEKREEG